MLTAGDKAPSFSLLDDQGKTRRSSELKGRPYVLFFYPKDNTPGCTTEACSFRDLRADFDRAGITVFGVSADSSASHAKFVSKYDLGLPLLADPEHALLEAYGVWAEKSLYGRKFMGILRSTFAVGADGRISHVWPKVKPAGHAEAVLEALTDGEAPQSPGRTGSSAASQPVAKKAAKKAPAKKAPAKKAVAKRPASR
jgi:peroxiredoxin Q/BCP